MSPLTDAAKKGKKETAFRRFPFCLDLLPEVAVQQALEGLAVAGLVAGHFMDGVVDGVQIVLLGQLRQLELAGGRASLRAGERTRSPFVRQR